MDALTVVGIATVLFLVVGGLWLWLGVGSRRHKAAPQEEREPDGNDACEGAAGPGGFLSKVLKLLRPGGYEPGEVMERSIEPDAASVPTAAPQPVGETDAVRFSVYFPQELLPEQWAKLLVYVHTPEADAILSTHSQALLAGESAAHGKRSGKPTVAIAREASIRVVPELAGCRFNPPQATVMWLEDWHCSEFRVQAHAQSKGFQLGAVNGRVAFYVESVLVAEVPIWALITETPELASQWPKPPVSADPYDKIFVSYSHRDSELVASLARAYKVLGMPYLRDAEVLRSGEQWDPRLLELIESADIFQLYWSLHSSQSRYVTQEWRHAHALQRDNFIRPLYWEKPMPSVPDELRALHFAYLPGMNHGSSD